MTTDETSGFDAFENVIEVGDAVTRWRAIGGRTVLVLCRVVGFTGNGNPRLEEIATARHPNAHVEAAPRGGVFAVPREQVARYAEPGRR